MESDKIEQINKNKEMSEFEKTKKNYYDGGYIGEAKEYIKELEQQNVELMELLNRSKKIMCEHNMKGFSIVRDINKYLKKGQ